MMQLYIVRFFDRVIHMKNLPPNTWTSHRMISSAVWGNCIASNGICVVEVIGMRMTSSQTLDPDVP